MMVIDNKYEIGSTVYLVTDQEQLPRIVYGYEVTPGCVLYMLCVGTTTSKHFEFELSNEKNYVNA